MITETRLMTVTSSGGVMTAARSEGLHRNRRSPLVPRRKTSEQGRVGNDAEDQRVAAGSVGVMNRR